MCNYRDVINLAVVNFHPTTGDKQSNLEKVTGYSAAAAKKGAEMILFPELCITGYDFYIDEKIDRKKKLAASETVKGPVCAEIARAAKADNIYIVFGMGEIMEEGSETIYNSCVAVGPEGVIGSYQKIHPYEAENTCFAKGEKPFLFDTPWGAVSIGICYDTYQFPELMRYYASKGSRLYLNPTALIEDTNIAGSREGFLDYYIKTLEYGVICNTIFIASANLTGYDDFNYFAGASMILGPKITPFCDAQAACYAGSKDNIEEGISLATIDLSLAKRTIFVNNNFTGVPDYRPELYRTFR